MKDEILNKFAEDLEKYLKADKLFIQNPLRTKDLEMATEIACYLFPEAEIEIEDDPLHMGAMILTIKDFDIVVRDTDAFATMISKASNFEIFYREENVEIAILFNDVLFRI